MGLRLDLLAEVYVDDTQVGEGRLDNVSTSSSGFNNARLHSIPLSELAGAVEPSPTTGSSPSTRVR